MVDNLSIILCRFSNVSFLFLVLQHHKPKSVIRISLCRTTQRNPNDRFGLKRVFAFNYGYISIWLLPELPSLMMRIWVVMRSDMVSVWLITPTFFP